MLRNLHVRKYIASLYAEELTGKFAVVHAGPNGLSYPVT